jgi:hypothetical protein
MCLKLLACQSRDNLFRHKKNKKINKETSERKCMGRSSVSDPDPHRVAAYIRNWVQEWKMKQKHQFWPKVASSWSNL